MKRMGYAGMWLTIAAALLVALPQCVYAQSASYLSDAPEASGERAGGGTAQSAYTLEEDVPAGGDVDRGVVSLDFKDANLKDVLKVFSQQSGLNFVASKDVEDRVITLYMDNVAVEDALKTLMEANNLMLDQEPGSNILIVKQKPPPAIDTVTRVYKIRYYHGNVTPGEYVMKKGKGTAAAGSPASSSSVSTGMGLAAIIQPLLSKAGSVIDYMNLVIITDVPERFALIDQVISEIDRPIAEVMLEVEVIETTADFLEELGVTFSGTFAEYNGPERSTAIPYTPWFSNAVGATKEFNYGLISSQSLSWILEMLDTDTNTKYLAKPRVLVQDREWAEMKITADQVVSVKSTSTFGTGSTTTETEVERMEIGTVLRVVPIINEQESLVSLLLEPTISRGIDSRFTDPESGTPFVDPQERSLRTVVMVKSGETVAVGGFITTENSETKRKVPYLGEIPLVGALFRSRSTSTVDKELLIFITPRIITASEKVPLWSPPPAAAEQAPQPGAPEAVTAEGGDAAIPPMPDDVPVNSPEELGFREQEDVGGAPVSMTLKGAGVGAVDLVK